MNKKEGMNTKLWLEEVENQTSAANVTTVRFKEKKFQLKSKESKLIESFLKKHRIRWEHLLHAAWGLFLNRFSTAEEVLYGTSMYSSSSGKPLALSHPLSTIKSAINVKTKVKDHIKKLAAQVKKHKPTRKVPEEARYLLLFKAKTKKSSHTELLDPYRFTLVLCADSKHQKQFSLFYSPLSFKTTNVTSIIDHLLVILFELCNHPDERAININILTDNEKSKLLSTWSNPKYHFSSAPLTASFPHLFSEQAKLRSDCVAISHPSYSVNYKELDSVSSSFAKNLIAKGVKPGDRVCVFMERTPTWIMAMIAIFKAGAIYVPINPKFPEERIEYVLNDSLPNFILVNEIDRLPINYRGKTIIINEEWAKLKIDNTNSLPSLPTIHPEQIAYIIYTSGTTGKPKGVMIKHDSLINLTNWYHGQFNVTPHDRSAQFASQGFDSHICEIIPFLASGASVFMVDDNTKLTPSLFFDWIKKNEITVCDLPTAYALMLLSLPWPPEISLRLMKIGGEMLTHYPSQLYSFDIWNGYGPTEMTVEATYFKVISANALHSIHDRTAPPIGKPITDTYAYVVDSNLQPVPLGVGGELLLGGRGLSAGYLNREDLTKQKFIPDTFGKKAMGKVYRTGDLVRWLPNGLLEFIGRIDNQVKLRGYRIELGDIESAISQHPDVGETVVIVKETVNRDKTLVAYIVPDLNKERYLFQERCLIALEENRYLEAVTEDISKGGFALSGISEIIPIGTEVEAHLKLPGFTDSKPFIANLIWQQGNRCGFVFDVSDEEKQVISKSIDFYLANNNVMELVLSAASKRSLRKALRNKLPEYMVPSIFVTLMQFPLTYSGKVDTKALPPPQNFEQLLNNEFIAPKTETERKLSIIWCELLHKNKISMSDNFFDLGGSSLTAADLSVRILNQFNTSIPAKILFDLSYIPILAEYIDSKGAHYSTQTFIQEEIDRDCKLVDNIYPCKHLTPHAKDPQNILLTGAGGFLGIYLLRELLKHTNAKIYCLIRVGEFSTAAKRLVSTVQRFKLENDISLSNRRIVVIASDISFDNFGLPLEQYNSLLDKIDTIYHCGAQVNIMASYNKLRGSNVLGTLEVIKFATRHVDKPIHYISTLSSAYMKDEAGNLVEEFPNDHHDQLFGGYAISKWVSERMLTIMSERGLPISIYRSGYISGQSDTGMTNLNDALIMLIKGCIQMGFAPTLDEKITVLPVDTVSYITTMISLAYGDKNGVYHIDHPSGIMWSDLIAWLNDYGYNMKIIPTKEWQAKLPAIPHDNALFPFLPYYLAMQDTFKSDAVRIDHTVAAMTKLKLTFPEINDALLTTYFDYLCQSNFFPPKEAKKTEKDKTS